ncbi:flavodoxin domain-containing protein [Thermococcus sp.]
MKTLVVYATKYGSSKKAAEILGRCLNGDVEVVRAENATSPAGSDLVVLVGPIYGDAPLDSLMEYVHKYTEELENIPKAFLLLALDPTGVAFRGELHGGILYSKPLLDAFEVPPFYGKVVGG